MAARMDPYGVIGTTVGERYSVDYFVGVGRFSVVYRGTHLASLCPVAIKFLKVRPDLERSARGVVLARLRSAMELLGDVARHCPSFAESQESAALVTADGRWVPFVIQSWLDGVPLESDLVSDALHGQSWRTLGEAIDLLAPVADALSYAHARGVLHGGLAPRSLYLREESLEWTVVDVLDLGIAGVIAGAQADVRAFVDDDDPLLGFTPAYGAPEQFDGAFGDAGPWTDVFALALIVVELLIGRAPLGDGDDAQLAAAATDASQRPTPRALGLDLGPYVEAVFVRALSLDPRERYGTVAGFWSALRAAHRVMVAHGATAAGARRERGPTSSARVPHARPLVARAVDPTAPRADARTETRAHEDGAPAPEASPPSLTMTTMTLPAAFPASMPPLPRPLPASMPPLPRATPPIAPEPSAPVPPSVPPSPFSRDVVDDAPARAGAGPEARRRVRLQSALGAGAAAAVSACFALAAVTGERSHADRSPPAVLAAPANDPRVGAAPLLRPACPSGMAEVPGGRFLMGFNDGVDAEKPVHAVTLSPYCIDVTEVTVARFKACSDTGRCETAPPSNAWKTLTKRDRSVLDPICNLTDPEGRAKHPVNCVSWAAASAFCAANGARLPTEAEWELAARGADGRSYPWGDEEPSAVRVNACGKECAAWTRARGLTQSAMYRETDGFPTTAPVGSFTAGDSPYGVHDLAGNVWEWTSDVYAGYSGAAAIDPTGPATGSERVIRGGGWNGDAKPAARATMRRHGADTLRSHAVGFRCAQSLTL